MTSPPPAVVYVAPPAMLTPAELEQLTGYKQPGWQARWLRNHEWVFLEPRRRGEHPRVARAYHDARMCGVDPAAVLSAAPRAQAPTRKHGPDLSWMTKPSPATA